MSTPVDVKSATEIIGSDAGKPAKKPAQEPIGRSVAASLTGRTGRTMVWLLVLLWTIPTFGLVSSSIRPGVAVKTTGWWHIFTKPQFTFANYIAVWGSKNGGDNFGHFMMNSLRIVIPSTIISVFLAALAAYAFSWIDFKGRDWLYVGVISLLIVPLQTALVPLSRLFNLGAHIGSVPIFPYLGLRDSVVAIWVAHTCFGMPFCVFLLRNFMSALPKEIMEAARIDGAGHLTMFRKVVLPLSLPALASLGIFQFVFIFNDLLIGKIFGGSKNTPVIAHLVDIAGSRAQSWHLLTASAMISMVLPLAVFFSLQRYFVRGLLAGAVKG